MSQPPSPSSSPSPPLTDHLCYSPKSMPLSLSHHFFLVNYQIDCHPSPIPPLTPRMQMLYFHPWRQSKPRLVLSLMNLKHIPVLQMMISSQLHPFQGVSPGWKWPVFGLVLLWVFHHTILLAALSILVARNCHSCCCQCYSISPINPDKSP
jgi:hypothetical protein